MSRIGDSFKSAVHENAEIPRVDKFNYLNSLLGGIVLLTINFQNFAVRYLKTFHSDCLSNPYLFLIGYRIKLEKGMCCYVILINAHLTLQ